MKKGTAKKIAAITTIAILLALSLFVAITIYNFNGKSFDFNNVELRYETTGIMDHDEREDIVKTDIDSIPKNSLMMIHKLSDSQKGDLKIGDVVAYHSDDGVTVKRIVSVIDSTTYLASGDAKNTFETIDTSEIYGIVVGSSSIMGFLSDLAHNPLIYAAIIIAILGLIAYIVVLLIGTYDEETGRKGRCL